MCIFFRRVFNFFIILFLIIIAISVIDYYYSTRNSNTKEITYSQLLQKIEHQSIADVSIFDQDHRLQGKLKNGEKFFTIIPTDSSGLINVLQQNRIDIKFEQSPRPWWKKE